MELGEKLLRARQEAGLSQRQLCGDMITRNMLSRIEHGAARPSMDTLRYLAERLGKPVSFFLGEDVVLSPNQMLIETARTCWQAGDGEKTRQLLQQFQSPDEIFDWEYRFLMAVSTLDTAWQSASEGKTIYARQLLEEAKSVTSVLPGLERQRLLQLGQLPEADPVRIAEQLPSLDEELLLRAEAALRRQEVSRAADLLAAAEDRDNPRWYRLRGNMLVLQKQYALAAECLEKAETAYPKDCWPLLETCFRELGDFQKAYFYACKQK